MPNTMSQIASPKSPFLMTTSHSPKIDSQKPWINQWDMGFLMNAMYVESCGSSNTIWYIMCLYIYTYIYNYTHLYIYIYIV
jgi:hypothetical protein